MCYSIKKQGEKTSKNGSEDELCSDALAPVAGPHCPVLQRRGMLVTDSPELLLLQQLRTSLLVQESGADFSFIIPPWGRQRPGRRGPGQTKGQAPCLKVGRLCGTSCTPKRSQGTGLKRVSAKTASFVVHFCSPAPIWLLLSPFPGEPSFNKQLSQRSPSQVCFWRSRYPRVGGG